MDFVLAQLFKLAEGMLSTKRRQPAIRRRLLAGVVLAPLLLRMACCSVYGPNGWVAYYKKKAEYQHLLQARQKLEKENKDLEQQIGALKSNPRAIEAAAQDLGLVRPGEFVYRVMSNSPASMTASQPLANSPKGPEQGGQGSRPPLTAVPNAPPKLVP